MKLAEALIQRADTQKRIKHLQQRLVGSARIQEGDDPAEPPHDLMAEVDSAIECLAVLIGRINRTNAATAFSGHESVADAVVRRDLLMKQREVYAALTEAASDRETRFSKSEIRHLSTVNVKALRTRIDLISKQYREMDTRIQGLNWTTDLLD